MGTSLGYHYFYFLPSFDFKTMSLDLPKAFCSQTIYTLNVPFRTIKASDNLIVRHICSFAFATSTGIVVIYFHRKLLHAHADFNLEGVARE